MKTYQLICVGVTLLAIWLTYTQFMVIPTFMDNINIGQKGIIIPMGPHSLQFAGAYATIRAIRDRWKRDIPIELWTYKGEASELPPTVYEFLESENNVKLRIIPVPLDVKRNIPTWDTKGEWYRDYYRFASMPLALIHTRLAEVVALDADVLLFEDPTLLFEMDQYHRSGTVFFWDKLIDYWPVWYPPYNKSWMYHFLTKFDIREHSKIPLPSNTLFFPDKQAEIRDEILKARAHTQHSMDSSIVVMDRGRHQRTLSVLKELTLEMGQEVYSNLYGDKETYWMAALLAGASFEFSRWGASHWSHMSHTNSTPPLPLCRGTEFMEPGILHYMPESTTRPRLLALNECKQAGCVKFGARQLGHSRHMSRQEHMETYLGNGGRVRLEGISGKRGQKEMMPVGLKGSVNGRKQPGVQRYHRLWYDKMRCDKFGPTPKRQLMQQRKWMDEGLGIYCRDKTYCAKNGKQKRVQREKMERLKRQQQVKATGE